MLCVHNHVCCVFQVKSVIEDVLERLPDEYNMAEMLTKATERSPYVLVCLQECERMNLLLAEIRKSLIELDLGLKVLSTGNLLETHIFTMNSNILMRISLFTGGPHDLVQYGDSAVVPVQ